jgi:hypothetical protein
MQYRPISSERNDQVCASLQDRLITLFDDGEPVGVLWVIAGCMGLNE